MRSFRLRQGRSRLLGALLLALLAGLGSIPAAGADGSSAVARDEAAAAAPAVRASVGVRYWFASDQIRYASFNARPRAGNPSSTLDWTGLRANIGEAVAHLDFEPTGLFVKAIGGLGAFSHSGSILDRDYFAGQVSFSAVSSRIEGADLSYAVVDLGWWTKPFNALVPGLKLGPFIGYHRWNSNPIAHGAFCATSDIPRVDCRSSATGVLYPTSADVLGYDVRWNALRLGASGGLAFTDRLSLSGEAAFVPYARFELDDSHFLRQGTTSGGLGPVPNVLGRGAGSGIEAEAFLNYAISSNLLVGLGARYWGLSSRAGTVRNRPSPTRRDITLFQDERGGLLFETQYRF